MTAPSVVVAGVALSELGLEEEGVGDHDRSPGFRPETTSTASSSERPSSTSRFAKPSSVRTKTTGLASMVWSAAFGTRTATASRAMAISAVR